MKIYKKILIVIFFITTIIILGTNKTNASSNKLYLNNLEFYTKINSDSSMDVTETWNISIEDTNTLYKTFKTDKTKYTDISNVRVKDITSGQDLIKNNKWLNHQKKGYYYGGYDSKGNFEISWGVGLEGTQATRKYEITYTVNDAIAKYADYAELYWKFVGEDFGIDCRKIEGTILLPTLADSKEQIKVWGHTEDLNGEIYAVSNNKISFIVNNYRSGRYVEIRTLFPIDMIYYSKRQDNKNILSEVVKEETVWAEEANAKRNRQEEKKVILKIISITLCILISIILIIQVSKKSKKLKKMKKIYPTQELKYFREIPREKEITPVQAICIYNKVAGISSLEIGRIFSATLLDLSLKKIIEFNVENLNTKKEEITIKILKMYEETLNNCQDEKRVLDFLIKASKNSQITIKELQKYIEKNPKKIEELKDNIEEITLKKLVDNQFVDEKEKKQYRELLGKLAIQPLLAMMWGMGSIVIYSIILDIPFAILAIIVFILLIVTTTITTKMKNRTNVFTIKGLDEHEQWKGLKNFMEDFSMLDKKDLPEIVLWEKFLVYATALGIEKKVLKQLKIVYPDFEQNIDIGTYSGIQLMMNSNFSNSFTDSINSSITSVYSSGSGSGGGFSSGGGRWTEAGGGGGGR